MLKRSLVFGLAVTLFGAAGIPGAKADPRGLWLAQDGAKVRVTNCGRGLCAIMASPKSEIDPATGSSWTDKNNPDAAEQKRPLTFGKITLPRSPLVPAIAVAKSRVRMVLLWNSLGAVLLWMAWACSFTRRLKVSPLGSAPYRR